MYKPLIAVTIGDVAGIGPEITAKALSSKEVWKISRSVAIGDINVIRNASSIARIKEVELHVIDCITAADFHFGILNVLQVNNLDFNSLIIGKPQAMAGKAAYDYIEEAVILALANQVDAIVTAPLNKEALRLAGYNYPGHTEILAHLTKTRNYAMMFVAGDFRVILATIHTALKDVPKVLTKQRIQDVIKLANSTLVNLGIQRPRIGVAGLNPHAGENGMFGDEEVNIITPAITDLYESNIEVSGPYPADSIFYRAFKKGEFDIVVAMYHDQGCIPIKLVGFDIAVNLTVGLPIIRTSVDHGTAYDVASQRRGDANPQSLIEAIKVASTMARLKSKVIS